LIKKHPKTTVRDHVARQAADQIADIKDATEKVTLAQQYASIFTEPSEQKMIGPILVDAFADANRFDEAFASGSEFLKQNPDSLSVLLRLVQIGTELAKQKNAKFIPQSLQYGAKAIELVEADKKPEYMDDAGWKAYKSTGLPSLYQSVGLMNLVKGDRVEAKARLAKAAELAPADPFNYVLITGILNDEYQTAAKHYQSTANGFAKDEELKKVLATLDSVIDGYAHTIALAEGNERLAAVRKQYLEDLEAYYKYRHNNSTAGMQELIDKYKVPAKP
jgi:tetratricopeptide (TPR) repeat protein